ncbi:MAG TPA: hypothetical protein VMT68_08365 [Caulobacteraceae bacterium]|nr:hypothetical protein [Caulobacteraceae bacterium]
MSEAAAEIVARAKARGWPDGLAERALAVKTPSRQLEGWLQAAATENHLFQVERTVEVFERLANGPYRARELTFRDEEAFQDLWANGPEKVGDWEVTIERSPDALAQFRLQPGASISVIEHEGELVACTVWSPVNCLIGGKPVSVHYAQGLRVRASRRREGLGDLVRRFPSRALQNPTVGQVMYLRIGNANMAGFLEAVKFQADSDRPQKVVAVAYIAARASAARPSGLRPIEERDLPRCAELINQTHAGRDLFQPYGPESLRHMLDGGVWGERPPWRPCVYGWADVCVIEDAGRVVACGGLWDRGRDMREVWRSSAGEERRVEVAAALDLGCEPGREQALADLLREFASRAAALGRQALIADLEHLPDVARHLADLDPRVESRTLEWSPYLPVVPAKLGECYLDLRYW